eukprot:jgi/Chrzof1/3349/Cz12g21230.t1
MPYLGWTQLTLSKLLHYTYCLGAPLAMAEMKVFLAVLARRYSFTAGTATEWKMLPYNWPLNGLPTSAEKVAETIGLSAYMKLSNLQPTTNNEGRCALVLHSS